MQDAAPNVRVGEVDFRALSFESAVAAVLNVAAARKGVAVRLANAWCVVVAHDDPNYAALLNGPGLTYPDGAPVARAMRRIAPGAEQIRGPSLFVAVIDRGRDQTLNHFFLGATPETLSALTDNLTERFPGARFVGAWAPPFGPVDETMLDEAAAMIQSSRAAIVWVGMGSPKQDFVAMALASRTRTVCVGIGAAFDFVAGTTREAPTWVQRIGLEWLFRLLSEPKRLWRRYLVGNVRFLRIVRRP